MDKFNSDYEEYLEKNGIGVVKNNYIIWYQCYGTYIGTKTVYNPDMTDYYEIPCEKKVAISEPIETDIVFYTKSEAERYCEEHSDEDVEYWFETEKGGVNEKMSDHLKYLQEKRAEVLKKIKPICEAFGIEDYDYIVSDKGQTEILRIGATKIGCSWNSIDAVVQELVGYLFVFYFRERALGHFKTQVFNEIKCYWLK